MLRAITKVSARFPNIVEHRAPMVARLFSRSPNRNFSDLPDGSPSSIDKASNNTEIKYGNPTYDSLFKYVLADKSVCISFLNATIPDAAVEDIENLDVLMNAHKHNQELRTHLNSMPTWN